MVLEVSEYRSVKEAVAQVLGRIPVPAEESVPTRRAYGRTAAENVVSAIDVPSSSTSHMDGFAVDASQTAGASESMPARFKVVGSAPLGRRPTLRLGVRDALRVSTGSVIPVGATAVAPIEDCRLSGGRLQVVREVPQGAFVFKVGEDVKKGRTVMRKGEPIRVQDVGMLVSLGQSDVKVWRTPKVAILATGSELTNSSTRITGKTRNSHGPVFASLLKALGCDVIDLGIAPDEVNLILRKLARGLRRSDAVFMTGGTSVGNLDLAEDVMRRLRPSVFCHGIRMDRGRVSGVAVVRGKGIVLMPGPIQGAMNAFILLGLPILERISGRTGHALTFTARLTRRWEARNRFPNFTKVVYLRIFRTREGIAAEPLSGETESMSLMTDSNAFAVVPENVTSMEAGRAVEARLIPGFSFTS